MSRSKRVVVEFEVSWASEEEERNREDLENQRDREKLE